MHKRLICVRETSNSDSSFMQLEVVKLQLNRFQVFTYNDKK